MIKSSNSHHSTNVKTFVLFDANMGVQTMTLTVYIVIGSVNINFNNIREYYQCERLLNSFALVDPTDLTRLPVLSNSHTSSVP